MPVTSWSTTASSNATADSASGVNFAEGQAPSSLNDSMRSLMAVIKGDLANSLGTNGYQKFPNGLIVQWGYAATAGDATQAFPIAFPSQCLVVVATPEFAAPATNQFITINVDSLTTANFTHRKRFFTGGTVGVATQAAFWIAVGF